MQRHWPGLVLPRKTEAVRRQARDHLDALPGDAKLVIGDLLSELAHLAERIAQYDKRVRVISIEGSGICQKQFNRPTTFPRVFEDLRERRA